jgi:hypothetical protein
LFRVSDSRAAAVHCARSHWAVRARGPPLQLRHTLLRAGLVSIELEDVSADPDHLAFAAFALSGCNANQAVNPSSQPSSQVFAGHYVDYNPYDPIS